MPSDENLRRAEELLPCNCGATHLIDDSDHGPGCPRCFTPAVAAALDEAEKRGEAREREREWAALIRMQEEVVDRTAERDAALASEARLRERVSKMADMEQEASERLGPGEPWDRCRYAARVLRELLSEEE